MTYEIVKENLVNGNRSNESQVYESAMALEIGKLYLYLPGLQGGFRVLKEVENGEVAICQN